MSVRGDDARRNATGFAADKAVGELVAMIDRPPACRTSHQGDSLLLAALDKNLAFDLLEAPQRNRGLRPAEHPQSRRSLPLKMPEQNCLIDCHIQSGILKARIKKTIDLWHRDFPCLELN